ncbi:type IV secretion system protein VirB10 [Erythrobacter litoralis]|jgi:type IV secretion system protein VirB10|nr:TrbI/VirB10 family protein [Erythrobacter litoralis]AOL22888.1 type IV secretion system protein VirB10 [Erythrobacter litoralis]MEE4339962.1 TrbI/VirB10 family protein [Erythrobacter sp.]
MRLAMRLPPKKGDTTSGADGDPREQESAEVIDLASRSAFPGIADRKAKTDGLGLAFGSVLVLALGAATFWAMNMPEAPAPGPIGNPAVAPPQAAAPAPVEAPQPEPARPQPDPAPAPILARDPGADAASAINPYASPTMVYDASTASDAARLAEPAGAAPSGEVMANAGDIAAGGSAAAFASRIGGVGGAPAQARAMVNPTTTVTQGTMIPAVLETAINTDVPGYVRAVVSQDVRSFDGKKVLIPRSSRLIGQYQSGVQQGQKRAYVIWTRLIRPDGASVNIASPAVAFDGTTGLAGDVDSHFFKRFGSAMLLSVVGGLGALATGGVGGVIVAGGSQGAASSAVQANGEISPTIRVRMGEPIRVFTARDLDFSTVSN